MRRERKDQASTGSGESWSTITFLFFEPTLQMSMGKETLRPSSASCMQVKEDRTIGLTDTCLLVLASCSKSTLTAADAG